MGEVEKQGIICPGCGRRYAWQAKLAGRRVTCACGQSFDVPAAGVEDTYDMAEEPVAARPLARPAAPVLNYESKVVVAEERRRKFEELRLPNFYLPLALIVLGIACRLLLPLAHTTTDAGRAVVIMGLVGLATVFNVLLMLQALRLALYLVDLDLGLPAAALFKLGVMFVAAASLGGLGAAMGDFSTYGVAFGVNLVIVVYWILFSYLFKANVVETTFSVAIVLTIQSVINLGIWKL